MTRSSDQTGPSTDPDQKEPFSWFRAVLYPNLYLWLIFVSALDVILTRVILFFGGTEVNPIADWILAEFGRMGMSIFKFVIVAVVIICCEIIGRRSWKTARRLATASIFISFFPVIWSSIIIFSLILDPPPQDEIVDRTQLVLGSQSAPQSPMESP